MTRKLRNSGKPSRLGGWAFFLCSLGSVCPAAEPTVRFVTPERGKPLVVEVVGLSAIELAHLQRQEKFDWPGLLSVRTARAQTDLLGTYRVVGELIRFESRFPPSPGVAFKATFDPNKLPGRSNSKVVIANVTLPKPALKPTTTVVAIYPSGDTLSANHLRFYLHFSASMTRGEAYAHIKLLDDKGKEVAAPFLELDEELWDSSRTRFTLLFHPGRVKRGLKPREELGPVLEEGKRYTLVVDAAWTDADGNPLKAGLRKSFLAGPPDEKQPDPTGWKLTTPPAGTMKALQVGFPEPLDHALLLEMIWVVDAAGRRVAGTSKAGPGESSWTFTPIRHWQPGRYRLMIDTAIEDCAGNSIASPFEVDLVEPRPQEKPKNVQREFEVK